MPLILAPILAGGLLSLPIAARGAQLLPADPKGAPAPQNWSGPIVDLQNFTGGCNVAIPLACPTEEEPKAGETRLPDGWTVTYVWPPPPAMGPPNRVVRKSDGSPATPDELKKALADLAERNAQEKRKGQEAGAKKPAEDRQQKEPERLAEENIASGGTNLGWDPNRNFFPSGANTGAEGGRQPSDKSRESAAAGEFKEVGDRFENVAKEGIAGLRASPGGSGAPVVRAPADAIKTNAAQRGAIAPAERTFETINVPGMNAIIEGGSEQVNPQFDKRDSVDPGQAPGPWRATEGRPSAP